MTIAIAIAIATAFVGVGLGGLALARVLHVNGIDAVVYERHASRGARGQGGMLDLHSGTGQRALREAGLFDRIQAMLMSPDAGRNMPAFFRPAGGASVCQPS